MLKSKTAVPPPPPEPIPQEILSDVFSEDPQKKLVGLQYIDKYLNRHQQAANRFVIDSGILPLLFDIIRNNDRDKPELLYTAAVCVSCISAGSEDETLIVQEASLIHPIYAIFDSKYDEAWDYRIKSQIGLIIGNIAGNNVPSRDYILEECDGYEQILRRLKEFTTQVDSMNNAIKEKTQYIKIQKIHKNQKNQKDAKPQVDSNVLSASSNEGVPVDEVDAFPPSSEIGEEEVKPASIDYTDSSRSNDNHTSNDSEKDIKLPPSMEYQKYKLAYVRTLLWIMSNFYRSSPRPLHHLQVEKFPLIEYISIFWELIDFEIQRDIAWLISYITDVNEQSMSLIMNHSHSSLLKIMREYLRKSQVMSNSNYIDVLHPILRIYGNFASGSDEHTNILLNHNFLQLAENLMKSPAAVPKIQQEICFIVSNVLVGSPHQRRAVLESSIMRYIVSVLLTGSTDKVRKEAVWALGGLLQEEISTTEVDHLSKQPFSKSSVAYQDKVRYFILETIQSVRNEGYVDAADGMIKQLTSRQHHLNFFL